MSETIPTELRAWYFSGFFEDETERAAQDLINFLVSKYGNPIGCGTTRMVFESKNNVIKVPINDAGISSNDWEGSCSNEIYAKTKGIWLDNGLVIVVQEKLDLDFKFEKNNIIKDGSSFKYPDWVNGIDCQQVGFDKNGNLKAYDYG